MCGIAGFFQANQPLPDGAGVLGRLCRAIHHRGPDDNGQFLSRTGQAGLTSARLAILDLSPAGHQPMATPDGRYTIVFNGEIYNFAALRAELAADGVEFRSNGDTEVILQLYIRHGSACVERLQGMFAFAIWDEYEQGAFVARDPLGIKPLYFYQKPGDGTFAFASEIRPLLASGLVPKKLNASALADYFRTGTPPEPDTLIENVHMLEAGSHLWWRAGKVKTMRYWSLPFHSATADAASGMDEAEAVRITRAALIESLERHFVSDVPVGLFLSGGLDSTALLALAQVAGHRNLRTFSIGVDHQHFDESSLARRTAEHFGTRHEEWQLNGANSRELFSDFLAHTDQPSIDGFNTFAVSRLAHNSDMKVVLSGLGGDEIFGGYPIFQGLPRILQASRWLGALGPGRKAIGRALERWAPRPAWQRLGAFLSGPPTLLSGYLAYRGIYTERESLALASAYAGHAPVAPGRAATGGPADASLDAISALEIERYMRNQLLRDSDVMSMANSLELRVPFVDSHLLETVARIPATWRLQPGKRLLVRAVPEVPAWIADQPKRGFSFPFEEWLATEWKGCFDQGAPGPARSGRTWYQRWAIFLFEHWWNQLV